MFEKRKLQKELKIKIKTIEELEKKRTRSQAKLVEAILLHKEPEDEDVDYFNQFSETMDNIRAEIKELQVNIDKL